MRLALALLIALSLPLCLTACGGEEETSPDEAFNPYDGKSFDFKKFSKDPEKLREMMKSGKMPGVDPEALKRQFKDLKMPTNEAEAKEFLKGLGGSVTEAELSSWWTTYKAIHDAKKAGDRDGAGRIMMEAGVGRFALLTGKVMSALAMYEVRKKQGAATDADKQVAPLYDKYLALRDSLKK